MEHLHRAMLAEIGAVVDRMDDADLDRLCRALCDPRRTVVYGCEEAADQRLRDAALSSGAGPCGSRRHDRAAGRSRRSLPGELRTGQAHDGAALLDQAKQAGARTFVLTAEAGGNAARRADEALVIPAQTMASDRGPAKTSVLPMGSLYEGVLFVLFEVIILKLARRLGATADAMRARHTNLE